MEKQCYVRTGREKKDVRNVVALHFANMEGVNTHAKNVTVLHSANTEDVKTDVKIVGAKESANTGRSR